MSILPHKGEFKSVIHVIPSKFHIFISAAFEFIEVSYQWLILLYFYTAKWNFPKLLYLHFVDYIS